MINFIDDFPFMLRHSKHSASFFISLLVQPSDQRSHIPKISRYSRMVSLNCGPLCDGSTCNFSFDCSMRGENGSMSGRAGIRRSVRKRCYAGLDKRKS